MPEMELLAPYEISQAGHPAEVVILKKKVMQKKSHHVSKSYKAFPTKKYKNREWKGGGLGIKNIDFFFLHKKTELKLEKWQNLSHKNWLNNSEAVFVLFLT